MSWYTKVIIGHGAEAYSDLDGVVSNPILDRINQYFVEKGQPGNQFIPLTTQNGHRDDPYYGDFNHLNLAWFFEYLARIPWEYPRDVQVMICDEKDFLWHLFTDVSRWREWLVEFDGFPYR